MSGQCPVDKSAHCPVEHKTPASTSTDKCPVEHSPRSSWLNFFSKRPSDARPPPPTHTPALSTARTSSSIPKDSSSTWVYPSEAQFFAAMMRKNHNPEAADMKVIVPIHNAVNERAWSEVMRWEEGRGGQACGGVKLVNFKGRPGHRSLRAWGRVLLGYSPPFDRHDWIVDRCGTRIRYIIDFYAGHNPGHSPNSLSFFLDVRPALDSWESMQMRVEKFWQRWLGKMDCSTSESSTSMGTKSAS